MSVDTDPSRSSVPPELRRLDGEDEGDFGGTMRIVSTRDASVSRVEPMDVVWPASFADVWRTVQFDRDAGMSAGVQGSGSSPSGTVASERLELVTAVIT